MNFRTIALVSSVVLVTAAVAPIAFAEELAPLERPGTVMTGFSLIGSQSHLEVKNDSGSAKLDGASLGGGVSAEVFVAPHLTVGGAFSASWYRSTQNDVSNGYMITYEPTARVGVYLPLSDHVAFWPYAFGGFSRFAGRNVDTVDSWIVGAGARFVLRFDDRWYLVAQPIQFEHVVSSTTAFGGAFGALGVGSAFGLGVAL